MGVERFFNKTVILQRKQSSTGAKVEGWINISTTLKCCIYPINPSDALAFQSNYNIRLNITHKMNCLPDEDVQIDDKIICGTDEYIVKKVNSWDRFLEIYLSEVK